MKRRFWLGAGTSLLAAAILILLQTPARAARPPRDEYQSVLVLTPDRLHGETLFGNCARCHGANGAGANDGSVPTIAGQHFRVLARQLIDFRQDKRWDDRMEHFADFPYVVATQDVADVAGYVSSLKLTGPGVFGDGEHVRHGAAAYQRLCASCHGPHAEGDPFKAYPRLAGQHYPYLLRQLHDAVEGRRPNFSRPHIKLLAPLDRDDLAGICDYLSRLVPTAPIVVTAGNVACESACQRRPNIQ
jgi:cytochrome c553